MKASILIVDIPAQLLIEMKGVRLGMGLGYQILNLGQNKKRNN